MAHVNRQIRDAVKAAILASDQLRTVTSTQVSLLDAELPAAAVSTLQDAVEPFSKGPPVQEVRTVSLTVALVVESAPEDVEDELDGLRAIVEPLVPTALASIARLLRHTGSEQDMGTDEDGERWFGFLVLGWEVDVVTAVGNPEVALL